MSLCRDLQGVLRKGEAFQTLSALYNAHVASLTQPAPAAPQPALAPAVAAATVPVQESAAAAVASQGLMSVLFGRLPSGRHAHLESYAAV